jgi:hypothetical protein
VRKNRKKKRQLADNLGEETCPGKGKRKREKSAPIRLITAHS